VQSSVDPHTNEWLSPKCGDNSQHNRLRWVQSKEPELNKPHIDEIYNAKMLLNADHLRNTQIVPY